MIKLINLVETRVAPKKPFILFNRRINRHRLYINNNPRSNYYPVLINDYDLKENTVTLEFSVCEHGDTDEIAWINYLNSKAKPLSGVEVLTEPIVKGHGKECTIFAFFIPAKYFEIDPNYKKPTLGDYYNMDETKVTPKTNKIPIKRTTDNLGNYYRIPISWQGEYSYEAEDINEDQFQFYFSSEAEGEYKWETFTQKLDQLNIPYDDTLYGDDDVEINIDKKYFNIQ